MKPTRSLILTLLAILLSSVAQVGDGVASHGPGSGAGFTVGTTLPSANSDDIDAVKGTVGIVCVGNGGHKITWYPAAAHSSLVAKELRKCFEEVVMNWSGVSGPAGLSDDDAFRVPSPIEALEGLLEVMGQLKAVAP